MPQSNGRVQETQYTAELLGENQVPPVSTDGTGLASFSLLDNRALFYRLSVEDLTRITQAHIHKGKSGQNGPIVAYLFGPATPTSGNSLTVTGRIRSTDLVGPLQGKSLRALVRQMNNGNTYVNVHTSTYPDGAIRGQIRKVGTSLAPGPGISWREGSWS